LILGTLGTVAVAGSVQVIYEKVFDLEHLQGWRVVRRWLVATGTYTLTKTS